MKLLLLILIAINLFSENLWLKCENKGKKFYFDKNINKYVCKTNSLYYQDKANFEKNENLNRRKRFKSLINQAKQGNKNAYPKVAIMYYYGIGVSSNKKYAKYWLDKMNLKLYEVPVQGNVLIEEFEQTKSISYEGGFAAIISSISHGRYFPGQCEGESYYFDRIHTKVIQGRMWVTTTGTTLFHGKQTCYSD